MFNKRLIDNRMQHFTRNDVPDFESKWTRIKKWKKSCDVGNLEKTKETQIQGLFMSQIFDEVLGYDTATSTDTDVYNQKQELNSTLDNTEADGGLGFFSDISNIRDVRAVIELKDATTNLDKKQSRVRNLTPVEQGFTYANKNGSKCGWVIISNFLETRLYKNVSSLEYESFDIRKMDDEQEFLRFYYFLSKDHLIERHGKSLIDELYIENEEMGLEISNNFYSDYKQIRLSLFQDLIEHNENYDKILLFEKAQKIMDRFIFICFCEDCGLLPQNIFRTTVQTASHSFSKSKTKIWDELLGLFDSIDKGNPPMHINQYNGGLFREDPELDSLAVSNDVLESFLKLAEYDFGSELNVNILGQIFEQSISDVEQIKAEINGDVINGKGKQKEDGIFYTPYYVTRFIVENTIGKYLSEKQKQIKLDIFKNGTFKATVKKKSTKKNVTISLDRWEDLLDESAYNTEEEKLHYEAVRQLHQLYWNQYEEVLKNIKICDPSCGSGAFLNQCFDYLNQEMNHVLDMKFEFDPQTTVFDINKQILQNNLYGVDLNPESVEITKLALWLKTAKRDQLLTSLDDNIKVGNSIINDGTVVRNPFDWSKEFSDVFDNGGFDIIIGNPPYGAKLSDSEKSYLTKNYETTEYNYDTYKTFMELGMSLLKTDGYLGYITPSTYFVLEKGATKLRKLLFEQSQLVIMAELFNVFKAAIVETAISIYKKHQPDNNYSFNVITVPRKTALSSTFVNDGVITQFTYNDLVSKENYVFNYYATEEKEALRNKIYKDALLLGDLLTVTTGVKPYQVGKGEPPQTKEIVASKPFNSSTRIDDSYLPYMKSGDVQPFTNAWRKEYISYGKWLAEANDEVILQKEKLLVRQTGDYPIASYFDEIVMGNNSLHFIYYKDNREIDLKYALGLLNSRLYKWLYQYDYFHMVGKPLACVKKVFLDRMPVKGIDNQEEIIRISNDLLELCQKRFDLHNQFVNYIEQTYAPKSVSDNLFYFFRIPYNAFIQELKKQKVHLTDAQKISLLQVFNEYTEGIVTLSKIISVRYKCLNESIYKAFDLNPEEISIIEK
ncbi:MAG: N-6 DNA methylase [Firmicutes bacterium]|nr:N-6 DNA methylase [Bacillota bacterium]